MNFEDTLYSTEHTAELVKEYIALWQDLGLEDLEDLTTLAPKLGNFINFPALQMATPVLRSKWNALPNPSTLEEVAQEAAQCRRCRLYENRKNIVFGDGAKNSRLMFVGEMPQSDEEQKRLPFLGRSGELLTKIIEAMGYNRSNVYLTNLVKCKPPHNRNPEESEVEECLLFLKAQVKLVKPDVIVALGGPAAMALTGKAMAISNLRGKFYPLVWDKSISVMPTFHPNYLLRNPSAKRPAWEDLKLVKSKLEHH